MFLNGEYCNQKSNVYEDPDLKDEKFVKLGEFQSRIFSVMRQQNNSRTWRPDLEILSTNTVNMERIQNLILNQCYICNLTNMC